jgi:hypothetical protein
LIIPALGETKERKMEPRFTRETISDWIKRVLPDTFDEPVEHVAVLYEGERRDMFVGETSNINERHIRNVRATEIYRNNMMTQRPAMDPEELPPICGPAVLFPDEIIWK